MEEKIILSRENISGELSNDMPICVIKEICNSYSLSFDFDLVNKKNIDYLIRDIKEKKIVHFLDNSCNFSKKDLKKIAFFVNKEIPYKEWSSQNLINAFNHLMMYYNSLNPPLPDNNATYGPKTPDNPLSYDCCMIYRLCKFKNLILNISDTISDMFAMLQMYLSCNVNVLREQCQDVIQNMTKAELVNLINSKNFFSCASPNLKIEKSPFIRRNHVEIQDYNSSNLNYNKMVQINSKFRDIASLWLRINLESHEEAIILSALVYGIDISECQNPICQFEHMKYMHTTCVRNYKYVPENDDIFCQKYLKNPEWYDVRLMWKPTLNFLYSNDDLIKFAISEGYEEELNLESPLTLLNLSRCVPTFYPGIYPETNQNLTTISLTPFDELDKRMIISYGIYETKNLKIYSVSDIYDTFNHYGTFASPESSFEEFSKNSIIKLKNICKHYTKDVKYKPKKFLFQNSEPQIAEDETQQNYLNLLNKIEEIERKMLDENREVYFLKNTYKNLNTTQKNIFKTFFILLLESGYYMRGWKIHTDNLPIKDATYDINRQHDVEQNTSESLYNLNEFFENLPEKIKNIIKKLPLMYAKNKGIIEKSFITSSNPEDGITIIDRIKIVKSGEITNNQSSCIRLSSNWFLFTGYYYLHEVFEEPEPFDIKEVSIIS